MQNRGALYQSESSLSFSFVRSVRSMTCVRLSVPRAFVRRRRVKCHRFLTPQNAFYSSSQMFTILPVVRRRRQRRHSRRLRREKCRHSLRVGVEYARAFGKWRTKAVHCFFPQKTLTRYVLNKDGTIATVCSICRLFFSLKEVENDDNASERISRRFRLLFVVEYTSE